MNYENTATLVHELVKNPKGLMICQQAQPSAGLKNNELSSIQKICTQELSGDVVMFDIIQPLQFWE